MSPRGSSVYLIFVLINCLAFPPVTGAKNANDTAAIGEANGNDTLFDLTKTKMAWFVFAVRDIFGDDPVRIGKCILRQRERHAMLLLVFCVFVLVPLESGRLHGRTVARKRRQNHINNCIFVWSFVITSKAFLAPKLLCY